MGIPDEFRDTMQVIRSCSLSDSKVLGEASESQIIERVDAFLRESENSSFWEGIDRSDIESLSHKVSFFKKRIISREEVNAKLETLKERLDFQEKVKTQEVEIPKALAKKDLSRIFPSTLSEAESSQAAEALIAAAKKMDHLGLKELRTIATSLDKLNVKSETARFQIVEKILKACPEMTRTVGYNIDHSDIQTEDHRKKIGLMIAKNNVLDFKSSAPKLNINRDHNEYKEIIIEAFEENPGALISELGFLDIQDPAERLRLARCVLEKDSSPLSERSLLPMHIKQFKIVNSADRQALALELINKGPEACRQVLKHFGNFELDDPDDLTAVAHAVLHEDMFSFAENFQKLNITDASTKKQLIKMLMRQKEKFSSKHVTYRSGAATFFENAKQFYPANDPIPEDVLSELVQNRSLQLACHIQNFPNVPKDIFRSCMRILMEKCPAAVSSNYDNYLIMGGLDHSTCLEDARKLAEDSPAGVSENFSKFGKFTSSERFELAKFIAEQSGESAVLDIDNYDLNLEQKIEIFKISAGNCGAAVAENISSLQIPPDYNPLDNPGEINSRDEIYASIALECAKSDAGGFLEHIDNFTGVSPSSSGEVRVKGFDAWKKICKAAASVNGEAFGQHLAKIPIDWNANPKLKLSLAQMAARSSVPVAHYIGNFDLEEDHRYELAKLVSEKTIGDQKKSPLATHMKCFAISNEKKRVELALMAAQQSGSSVAKNLDNFDIDDPVARMQVLKAAARENGYHVQENYPSDALTNEISVKNLEENHTMEIFANAQVGLMNSSPCFDGILTSPAENLDTHPGLRLVRYPQRFAKDPEELTGAESQKEIDMLRRDFDKKILKQLGTTGALSDLYSNTVKVKNDPQVTKWFGYFATHAQTREVPEEKLQVTKKALECIAGLRIPKMRYNLTDLLLKYVYDDKDNDIFESIKATFQEESKDMDEKDAPLFYMLLLPMFDAQNSFEGMDAETRAAEEKNALKNYLNMIKDLLTSKQFAKDPSKATILKSLQTVVSTTQIDPGTKRELLKEIFPIVADRDSTQSQLVEMKNDLKLIAEIINLGHGDMLLHKKKRRPKKLSRKPSRAWEEPAQEHKTTELSPLKEVKMTFAQTVARKRAIQEAEKLARLERPKRKAAVPKQRPLVTGNIAAVPTKKIRRGRGILCSNFEAPSGPFPPNRLSPIKGTTALPFSESELSPLTASTSASDSDTKLGPPRNLAIEAEEESLLALSKEILQDALAEDLGILGVDDILGKFTKSFGSPRLEGAVLAYLATLKSHTPGIAKDQAINLYRTSIKCEMEGKHSELRYQSTDPLQKKHMDKLFANNPERLEKWKAGETISLQQGLEESSSDTLDHNEGMQKLPTAIDQEQYPVLFNSYNNPLYNVENKREDLLFLKSNQALLNKARSHILQIKEMTTGLQKRLESASMKPKEVADFNKKIYELYDNLEDFQDIFPGQISPQSIEFFSNFRIRGSQVEKNLEKDLLKNLNPLLGKLGQIETPISFQKGMLEFKFAETSDKAQIFQDSIVPLLSKIKKGSPAIHAALEKIQASLSTDKKYADWTIEDTDSWEDMLLCGTEVSSSCQNIRSDPYRSICLLSYLTDGKNRAVTIKDKSGKIVARRILRFLWDKEHNKPTLFMEKLYPTPGVTEEMERALESMCCRRAKDLGVPLVTRISSDKSFTPFDGELHSHGSGAPKEYVDGSSGSGGMRPHGVYTLTKNPAEYALLYNPPGNPQEPL